ncbi:restriction endonuclease subunit S [Pseudomonas ficuserectae]|uniref:restriction endonuclease subunit S n=1 Tax=Pseudomonas ficuserectae TaxID=53410 RepID=UPI001C3F2DB3|nr:restriction endonuclease subunit S [Pseudomonas ficuserectae]
MKTPQEWREVRLEDVCERITVGHVGSMADEYVAEGVPFLRSQNITPFKVELRGVKYITSEFNEKLRKSALKPGDVAVVRTGYPGTAAVIPKQLVVSNCSDLVIIRPGKEVDSWFLSCLFNSVWGKGVVAGNLVGVAQQHFNVGAAKNLRIILPPIEQQRAVVSILRNYDDLIENSMRRIEILEEMVRRLYEEWFIQFRFPGHEGINLVEGEFGLSPSGWSSTTVKSLVVRLKGRKAYKSEELQDNGSIIVVDQSRAEYLGFHDNEAGYVAALTAPIIIFGDHTCKMQVMVTPFSVGPNTVVFAGQKGHSPYYIYSMIQGLVSTAEYKRHWSDLTGKTILEAPVTLSTRYGEMVTPMFGEIELLRRKNRNLRAQRDLLLPKLISGEIDLSNIPMPT